MRDGWCLCSLPGRRDSYLIKRTQPFSWEYGILEDRRDAFARASFRKQESKGALRRGEISSWHSHVSPGHGNRVVTIFPLLNCMIKCWVPLLPHQRIDDFTL